jgi:hypothetical protein
LWIDLSPVRHYRPRVADSNVYDRFLVVFTRFTGSNLEVWGRMRLAKSRRR